MGLFDRVRDQIHTSEKSADALFCGGTPYSPAGGTNGLFVCSLYTTLCRRVQMHVDGLYQEKG